MKLMIHHQTQYQYEQSAKNCIQYIRMTPQSFGHQHVHQWAVNVSGQSQQQKDGFGNIWITSAQNDSHQQLIIAAQGIVELTHPVDYIKDDRITPAIYLQSTFATQCNLEMMAFAQQHLSASNQQGLIHLAQALLHYMPYTPGATHVNMTAVDAFAQKQGVCQDHTQVFIAMCRYLGFPARYVSGYLYVPDASHLASHAWAEIYLDQKWYCFDVSNLIFQPNSHVQIAVGRDYFDVAPVRGIREQGGMETMSCLVQVLAC